MKREFTDEQRSTVSREIVAAYSLGNGNGPLAMQLVCTTLILQVRAERDELQKRVWELEAQPQSQAEVDALEETTGSIRA